MPKASKTGSFRKAAAAAAAAKKGYKNTRPVREKLKDESQHEVTDSNDIDLGPSLPVEKTTGVASSDRSSGKKNKTQTLKSETTSADGDKNDSGEGTLLLSRGQRKRLAKQRQYQRKHKMIMSSLKLKHEDEQRKRIDGLDAIKEALLATVQSNNNSNQSGGEKNSSENGDIVDSTMPKPNLLKTNKTKQVLVQKETAQFSLVVQHPSFQADPFATIQEHLKNTLASDIKIQNQTETKRLQEQKQREKLSKKQQKQLNNNKTTVISSSASSPSFKKKRKSYRARPTRSKRSK